MILVFGIVFAMGCQRSKPQSNEAYSADSDPVTLTVSAAISLKEALESITPSFEQAYPNIQLTYNFASSGTLQRQIEQGAPVDLYFSASDQQMDALETAQRLRPNSRQTIVTNSLTLITPKASTVQITTLSMLADPAIKTIAMGEFRSVPLGQYTHETLANQQLLASLQPKLVLGNNAQSVLAMVETGNADAGIVYTTDAMRSDQTQTLLQIPENFHSTIAYPIAVLATSQHPSEAQQFIRFLTQSDAQDIFIQLGFKPIP